MSLLLPFAFLANGTEPPIDEDWFPMALDTTINLRVASTLTSALDNANGYVPLDLTKILQWQTGTGLDQADKVFHDTRTLAASATEDLDMAGVLIDGFGQTVTFARIKAVVVIAASGNTNNVNVTRPASNGMAIFLAAGDGVAVRPNGVFAIAAPDATGYAVTAGTGDLLTFTNSAGSTSVTYTIIIIGASA
jgi:hypothetical protein